MSATNQPPRSPFRISQQAIALLQAAGRLFSQLHFCALTEHYVREGGCIHCPATAVAGQLLCDDCARENGNQIARTKMEQLCSAFGFALFYPEQPAEIDAVRRGVAELHAYTQQEQPCEPGSAMGSPPSVPESAPLFIDVEAETEEENERTYATAKRHKPSKPAKPRKATGKKRPQQTSTGSAEHPVYGTCYALVFPHHKKCYACKSRIYPNERCLKSYDGGHVLHTQCPK